MTDLLKKQQIFETFIEMEVNCNARKGFPEGLIIRLTDRDTKKDKLMLIGRYGFKKEWLLEARAEIDRLLSFHAPNFKDTDLIAFALKNKFGPGKWGWGNGYVALPEGHPCYGMDYQDINEKYDIKINGGLTFSDKALAQDFRLEFLLPTMWIVGFDTNHVWDTPEKWPDENSVLNEANELRRQLVELKPAKDA